MDVRIGYGKYSDKTVMIIDNALSMELAILLSKEFKKVYYFCEWKQGGFPLMNQYYMGKGIPNIESIDDMFKYIDVTDLFIFTDILQGDLQNYLKSKGKIVWGSGSLEQLESDRIFLKETLKKLNMPVGPYQIVKGLDNLRTYLMKNEEQWIKISKFRGTTETFHSKNYTLTKPYLDELEVKLGPLSKVLDFIVENTLDTKVETGIDTYMVDGQYPNLVMGGIEIKDKAYLAKVQPFKDFNSVITSTNTKLSPLFNEYKYRGWFSTEVRISENKTPFFVDATCRQPWPPSNLIWYMYKNLGDIYWNTANGKLIEPICPDPYGFELTLNSKWAKTNWLPIQFPKQYRENIKLYSLSQVGNDLYIIPNNDVIGSVVASGKSPQEAIDKVMTIVDTVEGYDISFDNTALSKIKEEIQMMEDIGINYFTK